MIDQIGLPLTTKLVLLRQFTSRQFVYDKVHYFLYQSQFLISSGPLQTLLKRVIVGVRCKIWLVVWRKYVQETHIATFKLIHLQ